ncbi:MAG: AraC family transcriptional regulator [Planctomycetota bacterium]|nr:AraC family transcriptional regulator [Planctomycetota bacterium]
MDEIALDTGFYDQSAFAFQFRRTIGMAPIEYRTRYRDAAMAQASG